MKKLTNAGTDHHFNPLPPHGGRHNTIVVTRQEDISFQSTPSTRRETQLCANPSCSGEISIHSLHTEGDLAGSFYQSLHRGFQSTPSTRRETYFGTQTEKNRSISIHSLHTEGDVAESIYFDRRKTFQSTPSTRRETPPYGREIGKWVISIHSLHTEGDLSLPGTL